MRTAQFITPPDRQNPTQPLQAQLALILYGNDKDTVLCKHPVLQGKKGQSMLGEAHLVTDADRRRLLQALGRETLVLVQHNTLALSPNACAWWRPAQAGAMYFDAKYEQTRSIARLSGIAVPHPPLLFIAQAGQSLEVYALRENQRPNATTPLCHAPYWNVFKDARMCRGSVRYPQTATPESQPDWEQAFFQSTFTGPSRADVYMNWGKSYEELLEHTLELGHFPAQVLKDAGTTLAEVL